MTGLLHEKEFSRTAFIKGGGAMVIAVSGAAALAANAAGASGITAADNFGYPVESAAWEPLMADHPSAGTFAERTPADYVAQLAGVNNVDAWLTINADNTVTVTHGETETGAGTPSGIMMLVAEELNMNFDQMWYARPESWLNYTGGGAGSGGISSRSTQIRAAAAYAKQWMLSMASTKLGVPVANLSVSGGVISGGSSTVTYGELIGGQTFASVLPAGLAAKPGTSNMPLVGIAGGSASATVTEFIPGSGIAKPVSQYTVVGTSLPRIDIPAKVAGTYTFIQNVRVPGMVHARRVRPRGAGAVTYENNTPLSVNAASIAHIPGAEVVQVGNFLAVVAPQEYDAIQAAAQLEVQWETQPGFPKPSGDYWSWLREAGNSNTVNVPAVLANTGAGSNTAKLGESQVNAALAACAHTVSATYHYHYNTYVPIGPHCAVADIAPGGQSGTVYTLCQEVLQPGTVSTTNVAGPSDYLALIGMVLNPSNPAAAYPAPQNIRIVWYEGSGSYGSGQSYQAGEEAVIISTKIGKPVRVQWMRWDQTGWDRWGPAAMYDVTMGTDSNGNILAANWNTYSQASSSDLDEDARLLGLAAWPATPAAGGIAPTDAAAYNQRAFADRYVVAYTQPQYGGSLKTGPLRAPNAPQTTFASEQIVDELAHANNMDPVAFRVQNIDGTSDQGSTIGTLGARYLSVLDAATQQAGWNWAEISKNLNQTGKQRKGRGFAFGIYSSTQVAIVADVSVNMVTGKIAVEHLTIAQNNGITISPQGVANQMMGAAVMGVSRAMAEEATWNTERVTSLDWVTYPILRFADSPSMTIVNVHPGQYTVMSVPPVMADPASPGSAGTSVQVGNANAFEQGWVATGSGEPPIAASAAVIANAFFNATGARIRYTPMTPATARGALKAAGVLMS